MMSLRNALLTVLSENEHTGYELAREFDAVSGHFWRASHQQIYRELKLLVKDGCVTFETVQQQGKPDKKTYRLTNKGHRTLKEWLDAPLNETPPNYPLLIKFLASDLVDAKLLTQEIQALSKEHRARLDEYNEIKNRFFSAPLSKLTKKGRLRYLTLRRGILMQEARIKWESEALKLLSDL